LSIKSHNFDNTTCSPKTMCVFQLCFPSILVNLKYAVGLCFFAEFLT